MSETNRVTVNSVKGKRLKLRLSLRPDQENLCVSPAFFAAQLAESTNWGSGKARAAGLHDALETAGLALLWGDELSDAQVREANVKAKKFFRKVEVGPVEHGRVTTKGKLIWRVSATGERWPGVDVELELVDASHCAHLEKGDAWGSSPPNFGGAAATGTRTWRNCKCGGQLRLLVVVQSATPVNDVNKARAITKMDPATLGKRGGAKAQKIAAAGGTAVICGSCCKVSEGVLRPD